MTAVVLHALHMQFPLKSVILYYHTRNPGSEGIKSLGKHTMPCQVVITSTGIILHCAACARKQPPRNSLEAGHIPKLGKHPLC